MKKYRSQDVKPWFIYFVPGNLGGKLTCLIQSNFANRDSDLANLATSIWQQQGEPFRTIGF
jgi:hypothetical protein